MIGRGWGIPIQETAYIGECPICHSWDRLIFVLKDAKGEYKHCMICNQNFEGGERIQ